jgi:hypothetical protein
VKHVLLEYLVFNTYVLGIIGGISISCDSFFKASLRLFITSVGFSLSSFDDFEDDDDDAMVEGRVSGAKCVYVLFR